MNNNRNQPREYDAVLGGELPPPVSGVVLGGLEGVQNRLQSSVLEAQVSALSEALNYGDAGLEIVIKALHNQSGQVRLSAYNILRRRSPSQTSRPEASVKQALQEFNIYEFFRCDRTLQAYYPQVHSLAISPDGKTLVCSAGDNRHQSINSPKVWNLETGEEKFDLRFNHHHIGDINWIAISPDGKNMVSAGADKVIMLWDISKGKYLGKLSKHSTLIYALPIHPNGESFFSADGNGRIKVWGWNWGEKIATLEGHYRSIYALCVSPDGKLLISGGEDKDIRIWDINSRREIWKIQGHSQSIRSLAISPNGHYLVSGSDQRIKIWDMQTGKQLFSFYGHADWVRSIVFSPNSQTFLTAGDQNIKVWDVTSGKKIFSFSAHTGLIRSLALSPDGQTLVSGGVDHKVKVWRF
ncbi:MAG: WD40 repeat domain-containing protein [Nostoc sp. DedSLP03]|uniref:WD40 repeat domain-containing protein n=1 Tax=Nostoc sp. DedSLP03 TaxID=3075400 RepID=UPI002AD24986|nr:WD40 repeat domain-containing protein [Nostoc sp. DedSLP03]MDZ7966155.1 WD40 repeat domain-containing protein [Nostoc sp. DedSLP03]